MKKLTTIIITIITCLSFSFLSNEPQKSIVGKWEAKWDDIEILFEFQKDNTGIKTYSNPDSSRKFIYEVKKDSLFLYFEKKDKYPKYERRYKFSISEKDELNIWSKEYIEKFTEIVELVTYKRIE